MFPWEYNNAYRCHLRNYKILMKSVELDYQGIRSNFKECFHVSKANTHLYYYAISHFAIKYRKDIIEKKIFVKI